MANEKKVFRVLISETQGFYHDIEADSADEAMTKVRDAFAGRSNEEIIPIEDNSAYTGYQVEDATEIERAISDLAWALTIATIYWWLWLALNY